MVVRARNLVIAAVLFIVIAGAHLAWVVSDVRTYSSELGRAHEMPSSAEALQVAHVPRRFRDAHAHYVRSMQVPHDMRTMPRAERAQLAAQAEADLRQHDAAMRRAVWPWGPVLGPLEG